MESVFLVYRTDDWHSYQSRDLIGVTNTPEEAVNICIQSAKKENKKIKPYDLEFLRDKGQTQGYHGEGEFQFEEIELNKLL